MRIVYKKVKNLKPIQVGYIAGLIDGEGTITLSRKHKNENRQLAITVSGTEYQLIKEILKIVGAGKTTTKQPYKKKHSISYTYQIYNQQALNLLNQISSYLQTYKRKRAELVLKNYNKLTARNGKYSKALFEQREKFIKNFFKIKPNLV